MESIEEFTLEGRNFIYINVSGLIKNKKFTEIAEKVISVVGKYPEASLYTIADIKNIRFDTKSKKDVAEFIEKNKIYVKHSVIIGLDGIKKIFVNEILKMSGLENTNYAFSKEKAVEWLLERN